MINVVCVCCVAASSFIKNELSQPAIGRCSGVQGSSPLPNPGYGSFTVQGSSMTTPVGIFLLTSEEQDEGWPSDCAFPCGCGRRCSRHAARHRKRGNLDDWPAVSSNHSARWRQPGTPLYQNPRCAIIACISDCTATSLSLPRSRIKTTQDEMSLLPNASCLHEGVS